MRVGEVVMVVLGTHHICDYGVGGKDRDDTAVCDDGDVGNWGDPGEDGDDRRDGDKANGDGDGSAHVVQ